MDKIMYCDNCGRKIILDLDDKERYTKYCDLCGMPLKIVCSSCRQEISFVDFPFGMHECEQSWEERYLKPAN